jgi:hypothetical protein
MATIRCEECWKPISDTTDRCPHCGKSRTTRAAWMATALGALVLGLLLLYICGGGCSL